jgi:hypothetical protein
MRSVRPESLLLLPWSARLSDKQRIVVTGD